MKKISRRSFVKAAGTALALTALTACGGSSSSTAASTTASSAASGSAAASSEALSADVQAIVDRGVLKVGVKNAVKAVRAAITGNDKEQASSALTVAASVLAKAAGKGAMHWKKAARKLSRLSRAVNAIDAQ